jgi:hypothetical protein
MRAPRVEEVDLDAAVTVVVPRAMHLLHLELRPGGRRWEVVAARTRAA